jgi:hypothetical protein
MAKNCDILNAIGPEKDQDLTNDTGATLSQYEATVIGDLTAICNDAATIVNAAVGGFTVGTVKLRTASLQTSEATFATVNGIVYFDPSTKKFSDTRTDGYYEFGQLLKAKGSDAFIEFITFERAVLVVT